MSRITVNGVTLNVTDLPARRAEAFARRRLQASGLAAEFGGDTGSAVNRLARRIGASDTPIVMIHGLAASQAFWYAAGAPFLTLLGPCLLYDLRGHGKSETPPSGYGVTTMAGDLAALMEARGIARAHLVAHSFGGMIAIAHALARPETVESLTLVDVRVRPIQQKITLPVRQLPPAAERRLAALGLDLAEVARQDDGIGYLRTVARIEVEAGEDAGALLSALYRHPRLFRSRRAAERWIALTEKVSLIADLDRESIFTAADLPRLTMPMLVMAGGQSTTLPSARELARLCPQATFHEVPGVGHFFPMSQPRLFLRPAMRFLRAVNRRDVPLDARLAGRGGRPVPDG